MSTWRSKLDRDLAAWQRERPAPLDSPGDGGWASALGAPGVDRVDVGEVAADPYRRLADEVLEGIREGGGAQLVALGQLGMLDAARDLGDVVEGASASAEAAEALIASVAPGQASESAILALLEVARGLQASEGVGASAVRAELLGDLDVEELGGLDEEGVDLVEEAMWRVSRSGAREQLARRVTEIRERVYEVASARRIDDGSTTPGGASVTERAVADVELAPGDGRVTFNAATGEYEVDLEDGRRLSWTPPAPPAPRARSGSPRLASGETMAELVARVAAEAAAHAARCLLYDLIGALAADAEAIGRAVSGMRAQLRRLKLTLQIGLPDVDDQLGLDGLVGALGEAAGKLSASVSVDLSAGRLIGRATDLVPRARLELPTTSCKERVAASCDIHRALTRATAGLGRARTLHFDAAIDLPDLPTGDGALEWIDKINALIDPIDAPLARVETIIAGLPGALCDAIDGRPGKLTELLREVREHIGQIALVVAALIAAMLLAQLPLSPQIAAALDGMRVKGFGAGWTSWRSGRIDRAAAMSAADASWAGQVADACSRLAAATTSPVSALKLSRASRASGAHAQRPVKRAAARAEVAAAFGEADRPADRFGDRWGADLDLLERERNLSYKI